MSEVDQSASRDTEMRRAVSGRGIRNERMGVALWMGVLGIGLLGLMAWLLAGGSNETGLPYSIVIIAACALSGCAAIAFWGAYRLWRPVN